MALDIAGLKARHDELSKLLMASSLDTQNRLEFQKEFARIDTILTFTDRIHALQEARNESLISAQSEEEQEMKLLYEQEAEDFSEQLQQIERQLDDLLFPPDAHDNRSVYLEIRAGAGGQEAALFVDDLRAMYTNYALQKGWKVSVESSSATDLGGFREIILYIKGKGVFGHLKFESGVHRVQRVPQTETQGRVHTSTATVAVLPEAEEIDVSINPADLRIDVYRSSGAGGQHVNTTDSAVRITHIPTGVVVSCQEERSQHKNKAKAMKMLQSRILAAHIEAEQEKISKQRKSQVGSGMRAEKVRTYNYPQNRVTDHQIDLTLKKLDIIMNGNALDEIIQALRDKDRQIRKENPIL